MISVVNAEGSSLPYRTVSLVRYSAFGTQSISTLPLPLTVALSVCRAFDEAALLRLVVLPRIGNVTVWHTQCYGADIQSVNGLSHMKNVRLSYKGQAMQYHVTTRLSG